jgi:uncharacterized DUF497 family protein
MSKTREIYVWVPREIKISREFAYYPMKENIDKHGEAFYKAKLIIELPEKKIEITESEFDEARMRALGLTTTEAISNASFRIKKELGF